MCPGRGKSDLLKKLQAAAPEEKDDFKKLLINDSFVKTIENEYANMYLQKLNLESTQANLSAILKKYPLSKCVLDTNGWDSTT